EIELADQLHDLVDGFVEADVDQQPFGSIEDQVDVAAEPLARLVIHLDDVRKDRFPLEHNSAILPAVRGPVGQWPWGSIGKKGTRRNYAGDRSGRNLADGQAGYSKTQPIQRQAPWVAGQVTGRDLSRDSRPRRWPLILRDTRDRPVARAV